jgi:hypothetical protein
MQLSLPEAKPISLEELSPKVEELTKDIKEAIVNHDKELEKVTSILCINEVILLLVDE